MKKMMKRMLALMVMLCVLAPLPVSAVTTTTLKVSITGASRVDGNPTTVTATSGALSTSDNLAATVFLLMGSVFNRDWDTYEDAVNAGYEGNESLWVFENELMRSLLNEGWDKYSGDQSGWAAWVDTNFATVTGDATLKTLIRDLDSKISDLPGKNTDYSLSFEGYTVTVRLIESTSGDTPSTPSTPPASEDKTFDDVHDVGHWSEPFVDYVVARGLFSGTGEDTFHPDNELTRGMVMTVLAAYFDVDMAGGSTWYEKAMEWAVANGISDGTNPNSNITREQLAVMLWRAADSPVVEYDLSDFNDTHEISAWAKQAMAWAVKNDIMHGRGNGILDPKGLATRAEAAVMLMQFCEAM